MRLFGTSGAGATSPARPLSLRKDPAGRPAVDLTKVRDAGHLDLAKRADKAGLALSKRGLAGIRAQAVLVLDHSGSMMGDYQRGLVQTLVERVLAFSLQIDADGTVPVIPFDSQVRDTVEVTVGNYSRIVDREIWKPWAMHSTNLTDALALVRETAKTSDLPLFVAVVTDGNPDDRTTTTDVVCDLARYAAFLKFVAIREVPYLQALDDLPADRRLVDNVDAKVFRDPAAPSDMEFAEALADEWDTWTAAAQRAGILVGA